MDTTYEVLRKVGEGTFGEVFQARHRATQTIVALKRIRIRNLQAGLPRTVIREIQALENIESEHVVKLHEYFPFRSSIVLVLDYMATDLHRVLELCRSRGCMLPTPVIRYIMRMLLKALQSIHSHHIIHRDIKPSNLLLSEAGILKLGDFGTCRTDLSSSLSSMARVIDSETASGLYANMSIESVEYSHEVGTRWYRSPELLFGARKYTRATDIWSVGCILGELLLGAPLFQGDNDIDQLYRIFKCVGSPIGVRGQASFPFQASAPPITGHTSAIKKDSSTKAKPDLLRSPSHPLPRSMERSAKAPHVPTQSSHRGSSDVPTVEDKDTFASDNRAPDKACSTPNLWPQASDLPDFAKISFPELPARKWKDILPSTADALAIDLLARLLVLDPTNRITPQEALQHPFLREGSSDPETFASLACIPQNEAKVSQERCVRITDNAQDVLTDLVMCTVVDATCRSSVSRACALGLRKFRQRLAKRAIMQRSNLPAPQISQPKSKLPHTAVPANGLVRPLNPQEPVILADDEASRRSSTISHVSFASNFTSTSHAASHTRKPIRLLPDHTNLLTSLTPPVKRLSEHNPLSHTPDLHRTGTYTHGISDRHPLPQVQDTEDSVQPLPSDQDLIPDLVSTQSQTPSATLQADIAPRHQTQLKDLDRGAGGEHEAPTPHVIAVSNEGYLTEDDHYSHQDSYHDEDEDDYTDNAFTVLATVWADGEDEEGELLTNRVEKSDQRDMTHKSAIVSSLEHISDTKDMISSPPTTLPNAGYVWSALNLTDDTDDTQSRDYSGHAPLSIGPTFSYARKRTDGGLGEQPIHGKLQPVRTALRIAVTDEVESPQALLSMSSTPTVAELRTHRRNISLAAESQARRQSQPMHFQIEEDPSPNPPPAASADLETSDPISKPSSQPPSAAAASEEPHPDRPRTPGPETSSEATRGLTQSYRDVPVIPTVPSQIEHGCSSTPQKHPQTPLCYFELKCLPHCPVIQIRTTYPDFPATTNAATIVLNTTARKHNLNLQRSEQRMIENSRGLGTDAQFSKLFSDITYADPSLSNRIAKLESVGTTWPSDPGLFGDSKHVAAELGAVGLYSYEDSLDARLDAMLALIKRERPRNPQAPHSFSHQLDDMSQLPEPLWVPSAAFPLSRIECKNEQDITTQARLLDALVNQVSEDD